MRVCASVSACVCMKCNAQCICVLGVRDSSVLCAFVVCACVCVPVCLSVFVLTRVNVWCVWYMCVRVRDALA